MIERDDSKIAQLVSRHRVLDAQMKALKIERDTLRANIEPAVRALPDEKWEDDSGHAMMKHRNPSVSFDNSAVDKLARVWSESSDPTTKEHGRVLLAHRSERPATSYLEVK